MKTVPLLAAITAAAALALVPSLAHAESKVHVDPSGDVASIDLSPTSVAPKPTPDRIEGDVVSIRVTHLARTVRVSMAYRDLARSGLGKVVSLRVRSNVSVREVDLTAVAGNWAGKHAMTRASGAKVACAGLSHRFDYTANTVLVVIPRGCLGNPRWVRVAAYAVSVDQGGITYFDDARSTNYYGSSYVYGPRVHRG